MLKSIQWFIGCSGFYYKEWKGAFYPAKLVSTKWFDYYCEHFNTLELNVTFYRFPKISFLENWYNKSPNEFIFSVKAPRLITHYKQCYDCEQLLQEFYGTVAKGLRSKLGCILFQFPANLAFSEEKLDRITGAMDTSFANVVEFRNISWWNEKVMTAFMKKQIIFCGVSINKLPSEPVIVSDTIYYRFHGVPKLYSSSYAEREIKQIADSIRNAGNIKKAFVYFNNTASLSAITNARQLQRYANDR
ncbi:MAG TPA: DUF72 domain-containing protein [Puia sp.]|nr:DUF72 domain-containing protein [Puia sp.]